MAQVSPEAMIKLLQTVNKTQSIQIDEQTKTIRELRDLVAVPVRSFLQKKRQKKMLLPESARGRKRLR